jgi:hypothetical protein
LKSCPPPNRTISFAAERKIALCPYRSAASVAGAIALHVGAAFGMARISKCELIGLPE